MAMNPKFFANLGKSVAYSALNVTGDLMPNTANIGRGIRSGADMVRDFLRSNQTRIRNVTIQNDRTQMSRKAKDFLADAWSDVKQGNIALGDLSSQSFAAWEDYESSFDEDSDGQRLVPEDGSDIEEPATAAQTPPPADFRILDGMQHVSNVMSSATLKGFEYQTQQLSTALFTQMAVSNQHFAGIEKQLEGIQESINQQTVFFRDSQGVTNQAQLAFFDQMVSYMKKADEREIERAKVSKDRKKTENEKFMSSSFFDLSEYSKLIKDNFDSSPLGIMSSMLGMFSPDMVKTMLEGPGGKIQPQRFVLEAGLKALLPKQARRALGRADNQTNTMMKTLLTTLGDYRYDMSNHPILGMLGSIFGTDSRIGQSLNIGRYNKDVMSWNGESHHTLNTVIPKELAEIKAAILNQDAKYFDSTTGTFLTQDQIKENVRMRYQQAMETPFANIFNSLSMNPDAVRDKKFWSGMDDEAQRQISEIVQLAIDNKAGATKDIRVALDSAMRGAVESQEGGTRTDSQRMVMSLINAVNEARNNRRTLMDELEQNPGAFGQVADELTDRRGFISYDKLSQFMGQGRIDLAAANGGRYTLDGQRIDLMNEDQRQLYQEQLDTASSFTQKIRDLQNSQNRFVSKFGEIVNGFIDFETGVGGGRYSQAVTDKIDDASNLAYRVAMLGEYPEFAKRFRKEGGGFDFSSDPTVLAELTRIMSPTGSDLASRILPETDTQRATPTPPIPPTRLENIIAPPAAATDTGSIISQQAPIENVVESIIAPTVNAVLDEMASAEQAPTPEVRPQIAPLNLPTSRPAPNPVTESIITSGTVYGAEAADYLAALGDMQGYPEGMGQAPVSPIGINPDVLGATPTPKATTSASLADESNQNPTQLESMTEQHSGVVNEAYDRDVGNTDAANRTAEATEATSEAVTEAYGPKGFMRKVFDNPLLKKLWDMLKKSALGKAVGKQVEKGKEYFKTLFMEDYVDEAGEVHKSVFSNLKELGGQYKDMLMNTLGFRPDGEPQEDAPEGTVVQAAREASEQMKNSVKSLFGGSEGEDPEGSSNEILKQLNATVRKHAPKVLTGAVIGAGLSMTTGGKLGLIGKLFLPGNPIGAAIAGAGISLLARSDAVQNMLFGKEGADGEREGGLISKQMRDGFKKAIPTLGLGAGAGVILKVLGGTLGIGGKAAAVGGLIPSMLGPGGVMGAAIMGAAGAFALRNEKVQNILFGEADEDGTRTGTLLSGMYNKLTGKVKGEANKGKKGLGKRALSILKWAGLGAVGGAALSHMGILGGALTFGGPIGAAIAAATVGIFASEDRFQNYLFGTQDDKGKRKKDGLFSRISTAIELNLLEPAKNWFNTTAEEFAWHLRSAIEVPARLAFGPIIDAMTDIGQTAKLSIEEAFKAVAEKVTKTITHILTPIGSSFMKWILKPLGNLAGGLLKGGLFAAGSLAGAPLQLLANLVSPMRREGNKALSKYMRENKDEILQNRWARKEAETGKKVGVLGRLGDRIQMGLASNRIVGNIFHSNDVSGDAAEQFMDTDEGSQYSGLRWLSARSDRRRYRANEKDARKRGKQRKKINKLRAQLGKEDNNNRDAVWDDDTIARRTKMFKKLGVKIESEDDLRQAIYNYDAWQKAKENPQEGGTDDIVDATNDINDEVQTVQQKQDEQTNILRQFFEAITGRKAKEADAQDEAQRLQDAVDQSKSQSETFSSDQTPREYRTKEMEESIDTSGSLYGAEAADYLRESTTDEQRPAPSSTSEEEKPLSLKDKVRKFFIGDSEIVQSREDLPEAPTPMLKFLSKLIYGNSGVITYKGPSPVVDTEETADVPEIEPTPVDENRQNLSDADTPAEAEMETAESTARVAEASEQHTTIFHTISDTLRAVFDLMSGKSIDSADVEPGKLAEAVDDSFAEDSQATGAQVQAKAFASELASMNARQKEADERAAAHEAITSNQSGDAHDVDEDYTNAEAAEVLETAAEDNDQSGTGGGFLGGILSNFLSSAGGIAAIGALLVGLLSNKELRDALFSILGDLLGNLPDIITTIGDVVDDMGKTVSGENGGVNGSRTLAVDEETGEPTEVVKNRKWTQSLFDAGRNLLFGNVGQKGLLGGAAEALGKGAVRTSKVSNFFAKAGGVSDDVAKYALKKGDGTFSLKNLLFGRKHAEIAEEGVEAGKGIFSKIGNFFRKSSGAADDVAEEAAKGGKGIFSKIGNLFGKGKNVADDVASAAAGAVDDIAGEQLSLFANAATDAAGAAVRNGADDVAGAVGKAALNATDDVAAAASKPGLLSKIGNFFKKSTTVADDVAGAAAGGVDDALGAVGKVLANSTDDMANAAQKIAGNVLEEVTEEVVTGSNASLLSKALKAIKEALESCCKGKLGETAVGKFIKKFSTFIDDIVTKCSAKMAKYTDDLAGAMASMSAKAASWATPLAVINATISGAETLEAAIHPERLFKVNKDAVDAKMRIISGILQAAMSFTGGGAIFSIVNAITSECMGLDFVQSIASMIYKAFSDDEDDAALDQAIADMKQEVDNYNEANGTNLSVNAYNDLKNKGTLGSLWNGVKNLFGKGDKTDYSQYEVGNYQSPKAVGNGPGIDAKTGDNSQNIGYGPGMQNDPRWADMPIGTMPNGQQSTMATGGCGPTALSNAANMLGYGTNPVDMANMAISNDFITQGGASASLFEQGANKIGLDSQRIGTGQDIVNSLKNGRPVILSGKSSGYGQDPYTDAGHIVTATGMDAAGNVQIEDPMRGKGSYKLNDITGKMTNAWSIGDGKSAKGYGKGNGKRVPDPAGYGIIDTLFGSVITSLGDKIGAALFGENYTRAGGATESSVDAGNNSTTSSGGSGSGIANDRKYGDELGSISAMFESRGDPSTVSSGKGDAGGRSFGSYQFPSYKNKIADSNSMLSQFWKKYYGDKYPDVKPGDNEQFIAAWQGEARSDPTTFHSHEHEFITDAYYKPMVNRNSDVMDPDAHSRAAQEMWWSTSVQFGQYTKLLRRALEGKDPANMSPIDLINTVMDYKFNKVPDYFPGSSGSWNGLRTRFGTTEKNALLEIADQPPIGETAKASKVPEGNEESRNRRDLPMLDADAEARFNPAYGPGPQPAGYGILDGFVNNVFGKLGDFVISKLTGGAVTSLSSGGTNGGTSGSSSGSSSGGSWTPPADDNTNYQALPASEQQVALVNKMKSIAGTIPYSLQGPQDPDKGSASCASTVSWAYNKVLGFRPGSGGHANADNHASSTNQSTDDRFVTIYQNDGNNQMDFSKLQPGDIVYMNWDRTSYNGKLQHTEMYAGDGTDMSHGGDPHLGPVTKNMNDYRQKHTMLVRRWKGFMQDTTQQQSGSETEDSTGSVAENSRRRGLPALDADAEARFNPAYGRGPVGFGPGAVGMGDSEFCLSKTGRNTTPAERPMGYGADASMNKGVETRLDAIIGLMRTILEEAKSKVTPAPTPVTTNNTTINYGPQEEKTVQPVVVKQSNRMLGKHDAEQNYLRQRHRQIASAYHA